MHLSLLLTLEHLLFRQRQETPRLVTTSCSSRKCLIKHHLDEFLKLLLKTSNAHTTLLVYVFPGALYRNRKRKNDPKEAPVSLGEGSKGEVCARGASATSPSRGSCGWLAEASTGFSALMESGPDSWLSTTKPQLWTQGAREGYIIFTAQVQ